MEKDTVSFSPPLGLAPGSDPQRIARRFDNLRRSALAEAISVDATCGGEMLAAILTFTPCISAPPLYEFIFTDRLLAQAVHHGLVAKGSAANLRPPTYCRDLLYLQVAQSTLHAAGLRAEDNCWTCRSAAPDRVHASVLRAAIAAAGAPTASGLIFPRLAPTTHLTAALHSLASDYELTGARGSVVPTAAVSPLLHRAAMPSTARAYDRLLAQLTPHIGTLEEADAQMWSAASRRAHRRAAAATADPLFEGTRVAALGDLGRYRLTANQRDAAQHLICDQEMARRDVAARIGLPAGVYERRLRQFWDKVANSELKRAGRQARRQKRPHNKPAPAALSACNAARASCAAATEAQRIHALGDLARFDLTPDCLAVLQFRRDHPHLTLAQSAGRLGVTKDVFTGRLRRSWLTIENQTTA